jgi:hypothetical protein
MKKFVQNQEFDFLFTPVVKKQVKVGAHQVHEEFTVETKEGEMKGKPGDYLMRGVAGEIYVCDKDIFHKSYDELK